MTGPNRGRNTPRLVKVQNLTQGPVGPQLVMFAAPLFLGSLIQLLYGTVDLMFVSHILGKDASAAVGASSLIVTCILGFFTGLGVGIGVVAAKAVGMGAYKSLERIIHSAAGLTVLMAAVFTALGLGLAPLFLTWMDTPPEIMDSAVAYIRLYLLSLIAIAGYNIGSGILRALGDSKRPMFYQLAGGFANIVGNTLFIYVLNWGVRGAALSTACSQGLAAFLTVRRLGRLEHGCRLSLGHMRLEWDICRQFLAVGIPAAIQAVVITFSNIIVQTSINHLGVDSMAAFTAYFKVENFIYLPIVAMGQAASTFTSQNTGAEQPERIKAGVRAAVSITLVITVCTSALTVIFSEAAFSLFANEPEVIRLGCQIAHIAFPFYFLYVFLEMLASVIRGAGKALPVMVIIVSNMCVVRIGILRLMAVLCPGTRGVAAVYPLTWACTVLCLLAYYKWGQWLSCDADH